MDARLDQLFEKLAALTAESFRPYLGTSYLAETLADETEINTNIRVNTINPGPVRTQMRLQAYPAEDRDALARPEEITRSYLYLLGPASNGVTGRHFDIQ